MSENTAAATPPEQEITNEQFQHEKEICSMYIDCAKTYTQISIGALLLSLTFFSEIVGISKITPKNNPVIFLLWLLWLFAIVSGVTYQYFVVKYLETILDKKKMLAYERTWRLFLPKTLQDSPYLLYGLMVFLFYAGVVLFIVLASVAIF